MLVCPQCTTENSADSKFCKSCGTAFPDVDRVAASHEVEALITEGRRLLGEHRLDEAKLVAEAAVAASPTSTAAISLLGDCHEQLGSLDAALGAYERILEINPDSALDRIKVTFLRKQLVEKSLAVAPKQNKGAALLAAVAAVVLVLSIGGAVYLSQRTQGTTVAQAGGGTGTQEVGNRVEGFNTPVPGAESGNPGGAAANPNNPNGPNSPNPTNNPNQPNPQSGNRGGMPTPPLGGTGPGTLPNALGNGQLGNPEDTGNEPLRPQVNISPENPQADPPRSGPDEDPSTSNQTQPQPDPEPPKPERPSIVEITPSRGNGGGTTQGGSETVDDGATRVETLLRVARQHFQTGNFSQAADAYEKALRAGADVGSTSQRLAQSYERLGRKAEAIGAYRRAISAYEASLRNGGNEARLKPAIEACQRAISVLGG